MNLSSLSELECIALKSQEYLLDPLLICIDHIMMILFFTLNLIIHLMMLCVSSNVLEGGVEPDFVIHSLALLDQHHLLDCYDNIKIVDVLSELTRLNLSEIQKVLHDKCEYIC